MSCKKNLFLGIMAAIASATIVFAEEAKSGDAYLIYKNNVVQFCQNGDDLDENSFWKNWRGASFLRLTNPEYGKVGDSNAFEKYSSFLSAIKADETNLNTAKENFFPALKTSSVVYQETMNANFNCAIDMMRIKANKRLLDAIAASKTPADAEPEMIALKAKIEKEITALKAEMTRGACREMPDSYTKTQELKTALLDASFYQTCAYQFYLLYLAQEAKDNTATVLKNTGAFKKADGSAASQTTEETASQLGNMLYSIEVEQNQTQQALKKTLSVVNGFEGAYQMHILLRFIYQDYVDVRDDMRKLLFPIGQFIYKASNAQAPM